MSDEKNIYVRDSIDYIPKERQDFSFWNMLAIFMGMQVPVSYFIVGGAITPGLTLAQTITITLFSFIIGFLLFSLIGVIGQQAGVTTMVASRPAFGIAGSILPALITFVTLAGWDSVHIQLAGILLNSVSMGIFGAGSQHLFSILVGIIIVALVLFGAKILNKMEQLLVPAVLLLVIMALYVALGDNNFSDLLSKTGKGGSISTSIAFDMMIVQPLTWIPMVADYTRFGKTRKASFWAAILGTVPVAVFMNVIGQVSAISLGDPNPIIPMVKHGTVFGVVAFIVVTFATIATAALILYSATISALAIFPKVSNRAMASGIGVVCIGLAVGVNLLANVLGYLSFLGVLLIPLFPIMIVDYFFVHKGYDSRELFNKSGRFWYIGGFNITGYISWIVGGAVYFFFKNGSFGGAAIGMLASGVCYLILRQVVPSKQKPTTFET